MINKMTIAKIAKRKKREQDRLTPTQESSRVRRLSLRTTEPSPRDVQDVDHRVESFAGVSPGTADDGLSVTRPAATGVASLKQGLSKAYASSAISGSVTSTKCLPAEIDVTFCNLIDRLSYGGSTIGRISSFLSSRTE